MGLEIRQLVVKSDVIDAGNQKAGEEKAGSIDSRILDSIRKDVLEDCKEWLMDRQVDPSER